MRIELGTYYVGDMPEHEWQCQHCGNFTLIELYRNRGECGHEGIHRCEQDACRDFEISADARSLMSKIILSLQNSMVGK